MIHSKYLPVQLFRIFLKIYWMKPKHFASKRKKNGEFMDVCAVLVVGGTHWMLTTNAFSLCQDKTRPYVL